MSLGAGVLVAMPPSTDPNLSRTVVLLIRHGHSGSFGVVVDRPSAVRVTALLDELGMSWAGPGEHVVWRGGPVRPEQGWVLHGHADPDPVHAGDIAVAPGLAMSTTPDRLRELAAAPPRRIRILLGSIDWAPGQLAASLAGGAACAVAAPEIIFDTPHEQLWQRVHSIGEPFETGLGARLRRMFGVASPIPKATARRK